MQSIVQPWLTSGPEELKAACDEGLAQAQAALERFKALPPSTAFDQAVTAWDDIGRTLNGLSGLVGLFFQVHPERAVRERAALCEQDLSRFGTELSLDQAAWRRLAALDLKSAPAQADPVARRLVEHALRDYRRAGVDRDEATRQRVRALREELVEIGQEFSRNIAQDVRSIRLAEGRAGLEGLPEDWIAGHAPGPDGAVTVTTNPTDYLPFMKYARSSQHRQALYRAYHTRGAPQNLAVLQCLLARRHELATLLGYPHWAAYITEDKMIKTAGAAADFVERVTSLTRQRLAAEVQELLSLQREEQPGATQVHDWDRLQLMESMKRRRYEYDSRDARPYFAYAAVRAGLFATVERLYGLKIQRADVRVWHPDVQAFDITEGGRLRARFFLDMHPRTDKYKHAAMFDLVAGVESGPAGARLPEACLVCNFPQPGPGDPGLMEPSEVTTFFHEFGHLLHHLLAGRQRWVSVAGISTEWDFVEVPSQLFEEWSRDPAVLARFARHHQTGEVIPPELVQRMRRASEYGKGLNTATQMFYAALSLEYHSRDPAGLDTTETLKAVRARYVPFAHVEGTTLQTAFGHLEGYSALYYTYMWSLVLAKDLFSAFGGDLFDAEVAGRYRRAVLEPGGSKDAELLVQDFLGRPFAFAAFEKWLAA
ncbi:MAG: M3 family metallopeptidase [Planctomycetota bacterium]